MLASLLEQQNLKANHSKVKEFGLRKGSLWGLWRGWGCGRRGSRRRDGQEAGIRVSINRYAGGDLEAVNQPTF